MSHAWFEVKRMALILFAIMVVVTYFHATIIAVTGQDEHFPVPSPPSSPPPPDVQHMGYTGKIHNGLGFQRIRLTW